MKGCFVCKSGGRLPYVFREGRMEAVAREVELPSEIITEHNLDAWRSFLSEVEVLFCTWDMLPLTGEQIDTFFPNLKVVFYAAASVRYFARPFLERGIRVLTCHRIMAVPVAEFTLAVILLANKGALQAMRGYRQEGYAAKRFSEQIYPGTYRTRVGILGAGAIGSRVIGLLRHHSVDVMVHDPFLSAERMQALGLTRTHSLPEIFSQCQTVSNHLADNAQTRGLLDGSLFSLMSDNAAFINTGRGAQVVEADLIQALRDKPLRTAWLDVTDPEPVASDSPLLSMDNVFLFPHIAGYARDEVLMFPDFMIDQLRRCKQGLPFEDCEVTLPMLETMA